MEAELNEGCSERDETPGSLHIFPFSKSCLVPFMSLHPASCTQIAPGGRQETGLNSEIAFKREHFPTKILNADPTSFY